MFEQEVTGSYLIVTQTVLCKDTAGHYIGEPTDTASNGTSSWLKEALYKVRPSVTYRKKQDDGKDEDEEEKPIMTAIIHYSQGLSEEIRRVLKQ